ncbi:hypothetical protein [Nitrospira sp. BLG_1]|uniref:hypothetical protein n=1 Tax=Nitrospira sp. BLG_1 TaxID=3395883 RepID=UPI0039BD10D4
MSVQWRTRTRTAFRFWEQILRSWDEVPECAGQYAHLITHLKRFETRSTETFKHVIERGADPVYILHVLIRTCDESRVSSSSTFPQVFSQDRSGSLANLRDFHLITESDLQTIETAAPALLRTGQSFDQVGLERLRTRFEAMPEPPDLDGYVGEKTSLWTSFTLETPPASRLNGRPGEHWFNTGMVLLSRHLVQTGSPRGSRYTSIALLLNSFCPATYDPSPLRGELVRQRISYIQDQVAPYCEHFERWFTEWKRFLQHHPIPFNPWQS